MLLIVLFILVFCLLRVVEVVIYILVNEVVKMQIFLLVQVCLIFVGRIQFWFNGEWVKVFVLYVLNLIYIEFCCNVLQIYFYQLECIWQWIIYFGQGDVFIIVNLIEDMVVKVVVIFGFIGYVNIEIFLEGIYLLNIGEWE